MLGDVGQEHSVTLRAAEAVQLLQPDGFRALGAGALHGLWKAPDRPVNKLKAHGLIDDEEFTGQGSHQRVTELRCDGFGNGSVNLARMRGGAKNIRRREI